MAEMDWGWRRTTDRRAWGRRVGEEDRARREKAEESIRFYAGCLNTTMNQLIGEALSALMHADCPRCGHRSVYTGGQPPRERCAWPDCSWPDPPRKHYGNLRMWPDGTGTVEVTEG